MADKPIALAFHGHFYQPPRENPWTEEVPREAGAAPFHDWNEKIALEAYRPNAFARVIDEHGHVVSIINNYEHLSFDVGPTLTTWLADHEPLAFERIVEGDRRGGGGMAQAFFHIILPLATERDVRTMVRWGMREFEFRFGRRAEGIWLPETAVNDDVLRVLAEEGVGFTVLAPYQADGTIDPRQAYRWSHPTDASKGVDVVFYDGPLSHAVAFELSALSSEAFIDRVVETAADGGLVTVAADGETFGHHHHYGDRFLAYSLAVEAPKRGIDVVSVAEWLAEHAPTEPVEIVESAWSCAHGVGRWKEDCGCSTGGPPDWNQAWRGPLRRALDVVREAVDDVVERRGRQVLRDPWAARDAYVDVLLGATSRDDFASEHVTGDHVEAFTVLEAARHGLAMYTSCGWFFNDLAGLETVQVLRYAARALDCIEELGERPPTEVFLRILDEAESNDPLEGSGRDIWRAHVESARVDPERAVAQLALVELLERRDLPRTVGAFDVEMHDHGRNDRGALAMSWGHVRLTHQRTARVTEHVYAAVHLGGLEVLGATRPPDAARDREAFARLRSAFEFDAQVTTLLRLVSDGFGPSEFGVRSGVPEGAEQILRSVARGLSERFGAAVDRLYGDHRPTLVALTSAGYPLPRELQAPMELAMERRLDAEIAAQQGSLDPNDYVQAIAIARDARSQGIYLDTHHARRVLEKLLLAAVEQAVAGDDVRGAITALDIARELGVHPSLERSQEIVFEALERAGDAASPSLRRLAAALDLAS